MEINPLKIGLSGPEAAALAKTKGGVNSEANRDIKEIKRLSKEFEAIFLDLVLKSMRDSLPKSDLMGGGNGEDIFRSMLDSEYAKEIANQNMTGLARNIENQLLEIANKQQKSLDSVKGRAKYGVTPSP
jgi:flagellar protein FlgJ